MLVFPLSSNDRPCSRLGETAENRLNRPVGSKELSLPILKMTDLVGQRVLVTLAQSVAHSSYVGKMAFLDHDWLVLENAEPVTDKKEKPNSIKEISFVRENVSSVIHLLP